MYNYSVECLENVHTSQHFGLGWGHSEFKPNMEHFIKELFDNDSFKRKIHHLVSSAISTHLDTLTKGMEKNSEQISAVKEIEAKLKELLTEIVQKESKAS